MFHLLVPAILMTVFGCDVDCDDVNRIDGFYAVWSNSATTPDAFTGQNLNLDVYPFEEMFFNGWSEWDMEYVPSDKLFRLKINDQPYQALYSQDPDNCNAFTLDIQGTYVTDIDSTHSFTWKGNLAYFGAHLGGAFSYEDSWTLVDGTSGTLVVPEGEFTAASRDNSNNDDTGF